MRGCAGWEPWRAHDPGFCRGSAASRWLCPALPSSLRADCSPAFHSTTNRAPIVGNTALNKVTLVDDLGEIKLLLAGNESGRLQRSEDVGEPRFRDIFRETRRPG